MVKQLYGIEVAELILKRYCGDWVDFTGDGVFVKKELVESPDASKVFEWTPACEMDWDDAPDPLTHPALPANFSSQELAAFLLDGVGGGMVASEYGDFSDGPDKEALDLLGVRGAKARRVLQDTYANLRDAMDIVGYPDMALLHQAEAIRRQYHDARGTSLEREKVLEPNHAGLPESEYMEEYRRRLQIAVAPLKNLEREMERLTADADISWKRWRHSMVAELLRPVTGPAESVVQAEAIDLSMLAGPGQLIDAFGLHTGMNASWFKNLKDYPALSGAIKRKGTSGRGRATEPLFCPFLVMQGLMKTPRKGSKRKAFKEAATPWRMLKRHFPRVYDMHQGQSPLDD